MSSDISQKEENLEKREEKGKEKRREKRKVKPGEKRREKNKAKRVLLIVLILVIVGFGIHLLSHFRIVSKPVKTEDEMFQLLLDSALHSKQVIFFDSEVKPTDEILDRVFPAAFAIDAILASEMHHYTYSYSEAGDLYRVRVHIRRPSKAVSFFSMLRIWQLSGFIKGLNSDVEQVQLAKYYILRTTKYNADRGGVFSCLYFRECSDIGYAGSFYLMMKEVNIPVTCEFDGSHVWNTVYMDGEWWDVDLAADDVAGGNAVNVRPH